MAKPEVTVAPIRAGTEVLKIRGGVENVGIGRTKLGNVVVMVAEWAEKNDERSVVGIEVVMRCPHLKAQ